RDEHVLREWSEGTGFLARQALRTSAKIVPCFVSGVHSPRAKRLSVVRWAEQRGITTIAPLIQATLPGFRDVMVSVRMGAPLLPDHWRAAKSARDHVTVLKDAVSRLHCRP